MSSANEEKKPLSAAKFMEALEEQKIKQREREEAKQKAEWILVCIAEAQREAIAEGKQEWSVHFDPDDVPSAMVQELVMLDESMQGFSIEVEWGDDQERENGDWSPSCTWHFAVDEKQETKHA